jgi:ribonuclease E
MYLAKVVRVESSLQAAFIDFGGNRNGFLPFSEIHPDYYQLPIADRQILEWSMVEGRQETLGGDTLLTEMHKQPKLPRSYKIQEVIKRGRIVLAQVVREEHERRGAMLTTYLSLASRFVVLVINAQLGTDRSGLFASEADLERLLEVEKELGWPTDLTVLLRKAGANQPKAALKRDCLRLLKIWDEIRDRTLTLNAPSLAYEAPSKPL